MPTQIFISHNTNDKNVAVAVLEFLRSEGYPSERLFLDSDPRSGLAPGLRWEGELYRSINNCVCLVVVSTKSWGDSKWCFAEALIAKNLDRKIVALLVEGDSAPAIVAEYQSIRNFEIADNSKLQELLIALERLNLSPPANDDEDSGWAITLPDASTRQALESEVLKTLRTGKASKIIGLATIVLIVVFFGLAVLYVNRDQIDRWMNPPEVVEMSTDAFLDKVQQPSERESIVGKKLQSIRGTPDPNYAATQPRVNISDTVAVNINGMANGEAIPETLPASFEFSCVVTAVSPLTIGDETLSYTVYVKEFNLIRETELP